MKSFRRLPGAMAAILAVLIVAPLTPFARAGDVQAPSLRVFAAATKVKLSSYRGRVALNLGTWITPVGGDFELRVARPDYDSPIEIDQVDSATRAVVRDLPADTLDGWRGLKDFFRIVVRDKSGSFVRSKRFNFCPNAGGRQRLDDTGKHMPTYPYLQCRKSFPFLRGMVWGVDDRWAVGVPSFDSDYDYGPTMRLADGRYDITVRVAKRYVELFEIASEHAAVILDVTVETSSRGREFVTAAAAGSTEQTDRARPTPGVATVDDPDPSTLPDLVALPAWRVRLNTRRGREVLGFASTPWNAGPGPLVVEGFRRADESTMDAYQYFYDRDGNVTGRTPVGTMKYHAKRGHHHWHFLQFARFSLLSADEGEVVRSRKQAFCIAPTDPVDLAVEGAQFYSYSFWLGGSSCGSAGSLWVREVLEAGWGDTYYQGVAGQAFDVTGLPNGRYYIKIEVDPMGKLLQKTTDNDSELREIRLWGKPGQRRLTVMPWHGIRA